MNVQTPKKLLAKDFETDQDVRWCPGCGDYAILKGVQKALADMGADSENTVFVSGIGCAARFPYYMNTYGLHGIHGRAPSIATGVKLANPKLTVWVVGGDGDGLSIGGNHTMHAIRRNIDLNYLLFNNEIYGLTKGQYSPTSRLGTKSPSTPQGSVDPPVSALAFAMGANARFIARSIDRRQDHMPKVLKRAAEHKGCSFVEIIQNCIVYNDGAFDHFAEKEVKDEGQLELEHGKPLLYAKGGKGIRFNPKTMSLEPFKLGENGMSAADAIVHDETNRMLAVMLCQMEPPEFPVPIGVLYCSPGPSYEEAVWGQIADARQRLAGKPADLNALLRRGATWTVAAK